MRVTLTIPTDDHDAPVRLAMQDPAMPHWARAVMDMGLRRDPVDAAAVLEHVARLFAQRRDAILRAMDGAL